MVCQCESSASDHNPNATPLTHDVDDHEEGASQVELSLQTLLDLLPSLRRQSPGEWEQLLVLLSILLDGSDTVLRRCVLQLSLVDGGHGVRSLT